MSIPSQPITWSSSRRSFLKGTALLGGLAAVGGLSACSTSSGTGAASGDNILVGTVFDGQGVLQEAGMQQIDSTRVALAEINETGGLLGRTVEQVFLDSKSEQSEVTSAARQLAARDDVVAVIGGYSSASREAMRPVFNQAKKLYLYGTGYEGGVCDHYTFCTGLTPEQSSLAMLPYLQQTYGNKLYIAAADYNAGQIGALWVKEKAAELGMEVVGEDYFPLDATSFSGAVTKIQSTGAEAVYSIMVGQNHLGFYREFASAGLLGRVGHGSRIVGYSNEQHVLDPQEIAGTLACLSFYPEMDTPEAKAYMAKHQEVVGNTDNIGQAGFETYLAWKIWAAAVELAGTTDTEAVIEALESGMKIDTPEGEVEMVGSAHHLTHNVTIASVNEDRGFDIIETMPNIRPTFEEMTCDLINQRDRSEQLTP